MLAVGTNEGRDPEPYAGALPPRARLRPPDRRDLGRHAPDHCVGQQDRARLGCAHAVRETARMERILCARARKSSSDPGQASVHRWGGASAGGNGRPPAQGDPPPRRGRMVASGSKLAELDPRVRYRHERDPAQLQRKRSLPAAGCPESPVEVSDTSTTATRQGPGAPARDAPPERARMRGTAGRWGRPLDRGPTKEVDHEPQVARSCDLHCPVVRLRHRRRTAQRGARLPVRARAGVEHERHHHRGL